MDGTLTKWEFAKRLLPFEEASETEVYERLLNGLAHLWVSADSACVTEVTDDNMLHLWLAGGILRDILAALPTVEAFAKALDCRGIELRGRSGWQRIFPKIGYVPEGQKLVKYL